MKPSTCTKPHAAMNNLTFLPFNLQAARNQLLGTLPIDNRIQPNASLGGTFMLIAQPGEALLVPPELEADLVQWLLHDGDPPADWKRLKVFTLNLDNTDPWQGLGSFTQLGLP